LSEETLGNPGGVTDLSRPLVDNQASMPASTPLVVPPVPRRSIGWRALDTSAAASWRIILVLAALWIAAKVVGRVWVVVLPVLVALLLVVAVWPVKAWLERHHCRPLLASWIAFLVPILIVGGVATATFAGARSQFGDLDTTIGEGLDDVRDWAQGEPLNLSEDQVQGISDRLDTQARRFVEGPKARSYGRAVVEIVSGLLLTLVVFFFTLHDGRRIREWCFSRFPDRRQDEVRRMGHAAWRALRGYLRGTMIIGLIEAVVVLVLLLVVGVPMAVPLALLTGLAAFFPLVGAIVASATAVLATLVTVGATQAIIVAVILLLLQQLDGDFLQPVVMSGAVNLHPLVILLGLAAGGVVGGIAGAFLAVPLTAVIVAASREWRHSRTTELLLEPATSPLGEAEPPA
jgi:predicted PurR-regulated permease PerM